MTNDAFKIIKSGMNELELNYSFGTMKSTPSYPYFVGEYSEQESDTESGLQEATFTLNGFHNGAWSTLENAKSLIENYFNRISGKITITSSGNGVVISYENAMYIPTGTADLKRIQINLNVKEWKVN